jgi:cyclopropane fatty-acyl-phospholipid synthase-like methyltransferase
MQKNTIIFWCLIFISGYLSMYISNNLNYNYFITIVIFTVIYFILFTVLEYSYYFNKIRIKSEREALVNSYDWFDFTMYKDNFDTDKGDLTEGLYSDNYQWSAAKAMKHKYDTYFKYLRLKPGMSLLDMGCGYCKWSKYLKKRGIHVIGLTLSKPQKEMCESYKIKVYLEDFRIFIQKTNQKFDAVSALGSLEHLTSSGMTPNEEYRVHNEFFRNINRILNSNGRAIITVCNMNPKYPGWTIHSNTNPGKNKYNMKDYVHMYNLASFYGCGRYPHVEDYKKYLD